MLIKRITFLLVMCFTFLLVGQVSAGGSTIPTPIGNIYVQDFAEVLTKDEATKLIMIAKELEEETTAQVAVLTIKTTGEQDIAEYANKAFRQYGIGDKEANNGVLLVLAIEDRKVRIEVGYGLEGKIPDGFAGRILDEYTIPALKTDEPNKAIIETFEVLVQVVKGEYVGAVEQDTDEDVGWMDVLFLLLFLGVGLFFLFLIILALISIVKGLFKGDEGSSYVGESYDDVYSSGSGSDSYNGNDSVGGGGSSGGGGADRDW